MNLVFLLLFSEILLIVSIKASIFFEETDLHFYLYRKNDPATGIKTNISDATDVDRSGFDPKKDTFFYFHGANDSYLSNTSVQKIKNAILENYDVNVFAFDWYKPAQVRYPLFLTELREVGDFAGQMIQEFSTTGKLNLKRTTICGHSLGTILVGHTGNFLNGQIGQAIALEPTSDIIIPHINFNGIDRNTAQFVQVIHTDGFIGNLRALGNADYYVNGGTHQPTCTGFFTDFLGKCSHLTALEYYVESLLDNKFKATKCSSYWRYTEGLCANNPVSYMGGYYLDKKARGSYFLTTNSQPPYGRG